MCNKKILTPRSERDTVSLSLMNRPFPVSFFPAHISCNGLSRCLSGIENSILQATLASCKRVFDKEAIYAMFRPLIINVKDNIPSFQRIIDFIAYSIEQ
jgi:hypothetical protein